MNEDKVTLIGLPIPPQSNNMYSTNFKTRRRFKSQELVNFQRLMDDYYFKNISGCNRDKEIILKWLESRRSISIKCVFWFDHSRITTKDGRWKRLDISNRVKALEDSVSKMLGYDDSNHAEVIAIKAVCGNNEPETVSVIIKPFSWIPG